MNITKAQEILFEELCQAGDSIDPSEKEKFIEMVNGDDRNPISRMFRASLKAMERYREEQQPVAELKEREDPGLLGKRVAGPTFNEGNVVMVYQEAVASGVDGYVSFTMLLVEDYPGGSVSPVYPRDVRKITRR